MPVVKGGSWRNTEDEILKAAISKYGLNQWARISSLLVRKTPKQCKARWFEWLDPAIKKVEWTQTEDEKLLHLAKVFPTQWRSIAPIVGRTANQCLERYQKLLDEAEARDNAELGLAGTDVKPAHEVRKIKAGQVDPEPETKPAIPDPVDMEEDEKEMLSEARARLANTQGKKAKRKAREKQLDDSRRLASLQKRRELQNAGIIMQQSSRKKKKVMDYNTDIPFERKAAAGFYDTAEERLSNENAAINMDLAKQAKERKFQEEEERKRKRNEDQHKKDVQKISEQDQNRRFAELKEAEQLSKRRKLILPAPQVSEDELEQIVKIGLSGERTKNLLDDAGNEASRSLVEDYSSLRQGTPIRTPRAPASSDVVAQEARNLRALTQTQSSLLGDENTPLHEGTGSESLKPKSYTQATPNPLATPLGISSVTETTTRTDSTPSRTPLRTPRDSMSINSDYADSVASTPRENRIQEYENSAKLRRDLASLPRPKNDFELAIPEEEERKKYQASIDLSEEDAAERDKRIVQERAVKAEAAMRRRSQVVQRHLPRPSHIGADFMNAFIDSKVDIERLIAQEAKDLVISDCIRYPEDGVELEESGRVIPDFPDDMIASARDMIANEIRESEAVNDLSVETETDIYQLDDASISQGVTKIQSSLNRLAREANANEKKLNVLFKGYQTKAVGLLARIAENSEAIVQARIDLECFEGMAEREGMGMYSRLQKLREEVSFLEMRRNEKQADYAVLSNQKRSIEQSINSL